MTSAVRTLVYYTGRLFHQMCYGNNQGPIQSIGEQNWGPLAGATKLQAAKEISVYNSQRNLGHILDPQRELESYISCNARFLMLSRAP